MLPAFTYVRPTSIVQAVTHLGSPGSRLLAGGTDLLGCLHDGIFDAKKLVTLGGVKGLRGIERTSDGGLRIGAMTTLAEVASHGTIAEHYAALKQGADAAASPQLRNQGTLGGNLCQRPRCWYFRGDFQCLRKGGETCYAVAGENECHSIFGGEGGCYIVHPSDAAPALVALDARAHIEGPLGSRIVPLDSFFVLPIHDVTRENVLKAEEVITEIVLPPPIPGLYSSYRKVRARGSWDFALAGLALTMHMTKGLVDRARIVLSGVAPIPWRAADAESALIGQGLNSQTASLVAEAAVKGARPMSQNAYKVDLVRGIVEEAILRHSREGG